MILKRGTSLQIFSAQIGTFTPVSEDRFLFMSEWVTSAFLLINGYAQVYII